VHLTNPILRAARQVMETDWEMFSETVAHSLLGWSESAAARNFAALVRAGISQETIKPLVAALHELNVWGDLPTISRTPSCTGLRSLSCLPVRPSVSRPPFPAPGSSCSQAKAPRRTSANGGPSYAQLADSSVQVCRAEGAPEADGHYGCCP
jgi:hypothetical protein